MIAALGMRHFGTQPRRQTNDAVNPSHALQKFGKRHGAVTWQFWRIKGLSTWDPFFYFEKSFWEAASNAEAIYFNLDGFNLSRAWNEGHDVIIWWECPTNWEFVQLYQHPRLWQKTTFWQNNCIVPHARVILRAEIVTDGYCPDR